MAVGTINPSLLGVTPGSVSGSTPTPALDKSGGVLPGYVPSSSFGSTAKISAKTSSSAGSGDTAAATLVNPLIQGYMSNPAPSVGGTASGVTTSSGAAVAKAGAGKPDYDPVYIILIQPIIQKAIANSDPKAQADKNGDESPGQWDDEPDDA